MGNDAAGRKADLEVGRKGRDEQRSCDAGRSRREVAIVALKECLVEALSDQGTVLVKKMEVDGSR